MRTILEKRFRRSIGREKGQTLVLVLCFLALGGLTIANSLNFVTTSINDVRIHQTQMVELYSADAGLQKAIWSLIRNEIEMMPGQNITMDQFLLNTKTVDVNIYNTEESGNRTFRIISTASTGNRSGTTVKSYVKCELAFLLNDFEYFNEERFVLTANMSYTGNVHLGEGNANVGISGNLTGHLYAEEGNLTLEPGARVIGNIYLLQGNIIINEGAVVIGSICTPTGLVNLRQDYAYVEGDIHAATQVKLANDTTVKGDIYSQQLLCNGVLEGIWHETDPADYECPMLFGLVTTFSYEIQ